MAGDEAGDAHFGDHVIGIVGRDIVGADAHGDAGRAQIDDRTDALASRTQPGSCIIRHRGMRRPGKHRDVLGAQIDAVRGMDAAVEKADLFERHAGRGAIARQGIGIVLGAAGHVQMQAHAIFIGQLDLFEQQVLGIVDIGRVRAEPGNDPAIGGALLGEECRGLGQFLGAPRGVAQLHDAIGDDGADAGLLDRRGDLLGEEILVAEGGGARQQHLGRRQCHGGADIGGHQRQLGLADGIVPACHGEQALPFRTAAKQHHGRMGVGIDEAGNDEVPGQVEHLVISGRVGSRGRRSDAADPTIAGGDPPPDKCSVFSVHGEDRPTVEKR